MRRWRTALVYAVPVLAVAGLLLFRPSGRAPRVRDAFKRPAPAATGVFATGGEPAPLSPEVERCFATELPRWVSALSLRTDVEPAAAAMIAAARAAQLSSGAVGRLEALVALGALVSARSDNFGEDNAAVAELIGQLADELAAMGLGVTLDGDLIQAPDGRRTLVVMSFGVLEVMWLRAGEQRVRVLRAHRLDDLEVMHNLHGFSRPGLRDGVVLVDEIDGLAETVVEPALAPDAPMRLTLIPASGGFVELTRVERRAGEIARAELGADPETVPAALELAVARHEARHRLDYTAGHDPLDRVRLEVRAYLGELADDPATPRLGLALLARAAFDRALWHTADSVAAVHLLEQLAPELGMGAVTILRRGEIDQAAAAKVFLAATERTADEVRAAAGRIWKRTYSDPLISLVREPASL